MKTVTRSGLFDEDWYFEQNPDVRAAGIRGLTHYLRHGRYEGRNPNPYFDGRWYLHSYPDVAAAQVDPLVHYIKHGEREGRRPSPSFSPSDYGKLTGIAGAGDGRLLRSFLRASRALRPNDRLNLQAKVHNLRPRTSLRASGQSSYEPLISIILPVFNSEPVFLSETIESVLLQTYPNWELVAVDDGSTSQEVLNILKSYEKRDERIKVEFCSVNAGIARASQIGLEASSGEYVSFLDHDDVLVDTALNDVVQFLAADRDVDYLYTDHGMIDNKSNFLHAALKPGWSPELLLSTNYLVHFKVARRELMIAIGGFRPGSQIIQDLDVSLRLWRHGAKVAHLPLMLYFWRTHPKSVASGTRAKPSIERLALQVYNKHLAECGSQAVAEWPMRFRSSKVGAYKLAFPAEAQTSRRAVIISVSDGSSFDAEEVRRLSNGEVVHVFWRDPKAPKPTIAGMNIHDAVEDTRYFKTASTLDEDILIFVRSTARFVHRDWARELSGYLDLSDEIGLVGGKVLDNHLRVAAGAVLLVDGPKTMFRGASDNFDGVWLNMQIASNVTAVSSALMAIRRDDLLRCESLYTAEFGDWSGLALSRAVSGLGKRIVFNPWSKIRDIGLFSEGQGVAEGLKRKFGASATFDSYYNPSFSTKFPYSLG